jgi:hypothetical protein
LFRRLLLPKAHRLSPNKHHARKADRFALCMQEDNLRHLLFSNPQKLFVSSEFIDLLR